MACEPEIRSKSGRFSATRTGRGETGALYIQYATSLDGSWRYLVSSAQGGSKRSAWPPIIPLRMCSVPPG